MTINSLIIAETRIQGVTIRPVLGAYELLFGLYLTIHAAREAPMRAEIAGARISVSGAEGRRCELGYARPEQPFYIKQHDFQSSMTPALILPLQPGQVAALETLRGTSDLDFELTVVGTGFDKNGEQQVQDTWRAHVSRSDWIKKLSDARVRNILLLEVPLPIGETSEEWDGIADSLRRAEEQFRLGDYHACVASCRTVVQELGFHRFKNKDWAAPLLKRLAADRNSMAKDEREAAMWASLRHYTHQAHHGDSEGGINRYTRADAQLVLTLTASFLTHLQADGIFGAANEWGI
ncbi:hypothetical protein [Rhodovibrio salinarum]|uniref:hypothetical protein n=1 Tax=Rhodovibrio salinarum TaxID=1087 RepID=UPI0019081011|nr:hypothetical protein [Rhodovibrio salinarum]